jgi:gliding motility-associated-like protein
MKKAGLFFISWVSVCTSMAQCGYTATIGGISGSSCLGSALVVSSTHAFSKITWYQGSTAVATSTATDSFSQTFTIVAGGHGVGINPDQLAQPDGLFVDSAGNLYVADETNNRVMKWAPGAIEGVTVAGGNGLGGSPSQLNGPVGISVDNGGNVYIGDFGNLRVQKWAPGATSGTTVAGGNGFGIAANQIVPRGIYVDCGGNIYVSDIGNHRVQKWAPGATEGVTVAGDYGPESLDDQVNKPTGVWLDGSGNIYLEIGDNSQVQKWTPGAASGVTLAGTGVGADTLRPSVPEGIFVDSTGNVYICNLDDRRIMKWPAGGTGWQTVVTGNWFRPPNNQFDDPGYLSLYLDYRGNLYVTDIDSARVMKFERHIHIDSTFTPTAPGQYTALVTDINGYSTQTAPFTVIEPPPGPPSVQISASATATPVCTPISFAATPSDPGTDPSWQWQVSGVNVGGNSLQYSNNLFADSDRVICIMSSTDVCTASVVRDTSNVVLLSIDPQGHASVKISADSVICDGGPAVFSAKVTNGSSAPVFQWLVNGIPTGDTGPSYTDSIPVDGQVVYCLITSDDVCGLAKSNSIPITVYPRPSVAAGQVFDVTYGQHVTLDPVVTGDIVSYAWTPGKGLSDSTIVNPVAGPVLTTEYTLTVVSQGGCTASGEITVDVYTPLSIPGAFTPNGDGRNDVLYVLGGPAGSQVREFNVYDRWGQSVFRVHDVAPGDRQYGWNGAIGGRPAPPGTYVYIVVLSLAGGQQQVYKGAVELIR